MFLVKTDEGYGDDNSQIAVAIAKDLDEAWAFAERWIQGRKVDKLDDHQATLEVEFVPTVQAWRTEEHQVIWDSLARIVNGHWTLCTRV